jgi:hypothetical protein
MENLPIFKNSTYITNVDRGDTFPTGAISTYSFLKRQLEANQLKEIV